MEEEELFRRVYIAHDSLGSSSVAGGLGHSPMEYGAGAFPLGKLVQLGRG